VDRVCVGRERQREECGREHQCEPRWHLFFVSPNVRVGAR
jgi:hypothetical protein